MSELIDKIFDIEKLSAEINNIIINLNTVNSTIANIKENVKGGIIVDVRLAKNTEQLLEAYKKLNDNFIKGQKAAKDWQTEVDNLRAKTEKLTTTEKEANIEIAKARLELQAATKAIKADAIAKIENDAATENLLGHYEKLQIDLKNAQKAYKGLKEAELNSAKGKELLSKIQNTQSSLKEMDASMGNYQRNVGNYASALDNIAPGLGGLATKLMDISKSAKQNAKDWGEMGNSTNMGIQSMGQAPAGLAKITAGFKGLGQIVVSVGKAVLLNPIMSVLAALVLIVKQVANAINESEERTNKMSEAFARFKPILRTVGDVFEVVTDIIIKTIEYIGKATAAVLEFIGLSPKGSADKFVNAEKLKQKAIQETRRLNESASVQEAIIAEQREILADKENYTYEQRMAALKKAQKAEKQLSDDRLRMAELNLKALRAEAALDDNNAAMNDKLSAAIVAVNNARKESAAIGRKLGKEQQALSREHEADLKAEADAAKAAADKIIAARRRLIDSGFAIMEDGIEKELKMNAENFKRQIEDLSRNGELTKALKENLLKAEQIEIDKIKKNYEVKDLNDAIKADELILENMKRAGANTINFEKQLLNKRMEAEILAGADRIETQLKYQYLSADLETQDAAKRAELFAKNLNKEVEALKAGYSEKERELKRQFAKGLISREDYEKELKSIQDKAAYEANAKTIELLKTQLASSELAQDKRAEISKQISDLEIANENAVLDATIAANNEKLKSDQDVAKKREDIAKGLVDATMELFGAIGDFQAQKSENRIAELEKEFEKSNEIFEAQQSQLDGAIMSEENRKAKQIELDQRKAASEKAINDKIMAEKVKMAKWDKAQAIIQAIVATALSVLNTSKMGFPLAIPFIALAAAAGAVQVATIASQPLPAYEKGTDNHPGGWSLWGEKRAEIAVTPSGETFLADKPTVTNFDAGTKIYKSVSDYENFIARQALEKFTFDYDKMGAKMPQNNIILDSRGLWGIVNKQNERRVLINRKYQR